MIHIARLIRWRGVTPASCQALMLTHCHAGLGHAKTFARCAAETRQSCHAVLLSCLRAPKPENTSFVCCGIVFTLVHVWADVLHRRIVAVLIEMLAWRIEKVRALENKGV